MALRITITHDDGTTYTTELTNDPDKMRAPVTVRANDGFYRVYGQGTLGNGRVLYYKDDEPTKTRQGTWERATT